ncbi:hypothetical protein PA7_36560 [Pseudonocardia asaccharolytica DSM 44247 = NBRC 16224]|uniref:Uncharacterized protein n=1 Tax=Pseudonocardia asaccharolytica DSM 44247 = NBRC 16224 TaxID=1123024 RepID=A0A511D4U4_9PSEU|nr:hypothetical protein PA7_36560 [Pseudonocardia asaccharolytica DSM 44247 = NBRC 16224]
MQKDREHRPDDQVVTAEHRTGGGRRYNPYERAAPQAGALILMETRVKRHFVSFDERRLVAVHLRRTRGQASRAVVAIPRS